MKHKTKSVIIGRKKSSDDSNTRPCFVNLFNINNPHLTDKAPEKCLDFDKIHKIIIKGLDVNYLLQGNDLVINNLKEIEIKQNKEHLIIKGK